MKKILIIENNKTVRSAYTEVLEKNGYRVLETGIPKEALELIRSESPDLITLPEKMRGLDGVALLENLKCENPFIPVILTSSSGADRQNFRIWSSGAEVVLTGDTKELKLKIESVLK